jgi:predicted RNA-binding Zn-ribbon protein involved in translation (DUF1610 family)
VLLYRAVALLPPPLGDGILTIEFSCDHCGKSLSTSDEKAGRKAKCPQCGEVLVVPALAATDDGFDDDDEADGPPPLPGKSAKKNCPMCGESIAASAKKCDFCGEALYADAPTAKGGIQIIEIGEVLSEAWATYKQHFGIAIATNIVFGLLVFTAFIPLIALAITAAVMADQQPQGEPPAIVLLLMLPATLIGCGVAAFLYPGYIRFYIGISRDDEGVGIGTLFRGGQYAIKVLLWTIAYSFAVFFGLLLLIVPGVVVILRAWPYLYVICDENPSGAGCVNRSLKLTEQNWLPGLLLLIIVFGIQMASGVLGALPCIGIVMVVVNLFVAPYVALLWSTAYVMMSGQKRLY